MRATRRGLLAGGVLAALAPGAVLGQGRDRDVDVLEYLLRVQELESALYREALQSLAGLGGVERELALQLRDHEIAHVDALRATLRDAGGTPPARAAPAFGSALADPPAFLKLANTLEDTAVSAFNGAVPLLSSPDLRAAAVSIAQVEARHASLVRAARGRPAAPLAFDRPSSSQAVRSRIRPYERR